MGVFKYTKTLYYQYEDSYFVDGQCVVRGRVERGANRHSGVRIHLISTRNAPICLYHKKIVQCKWFEIHVLKMEYE